MDEVGRIRGLLGAEIPSSSASSYPCRLSGRTPYAACALRHSGKACVSGPIFTTVSFWKPSLASGTLTRSNTLDLSWQT